jgi:membrane protease YdiL (CAAX protease family)
VHASLVRSVRAVRSPPRPVSVDDEIGAFATSAPKDTRPIFHLSAYVLLIIVAEAVFAWLDPVSGTVIHAILLVALLNHATHAENAPRAMLSALALVPLLRLASVAVAQPLASDLVAAGVVWIPMVVVLAVMGGPLLRPSRDALLAAWEREVEIALVGVPLALAAYLFAPPAADQPLGGSPAAATAILVLAAIGEEMVFRGAILRAAGQSIGRAAVPVTSALFASVYFSAPPGYLLFVGAVGVLFTLAVARSGRLVGVVTAHAVMTVGAFVILPGLL